MSRINCHSAFKHYEMFHSRGGDVINIGSNNTSIFNIGGSYGGFGNFGGGGFWGGFGLGLGNALGSLFSGLFGGGMSNFDFGMSPSGMGGMFGGMGNFGFGMNPWGGFGNYGGSSSRVDSSSDGKGKVKDSNSNNADYAKLNKLFERKNNLLAQKSPKLSDLETLKSDIDTLAKNLDGNDDKNDKDYIAQLQKGLDDAIKKAKGDSKVESPTNTNSTPNTTAGNTGTVPTNTTDTTTGATDNTSNLTPEAIKQLTSEQISKLTPDEAKSLLNKLGALNESGDGVKATTNYVTLLLAQKSGLPLSCGHNTSLDNIKGADAYIKGKVSEVKLENNNITFLLETGNAKIQIECAADSTTYKINKTIENTTQKYEDATVGTEYEIRQGEEYGTRTGTAAMRRKKA